MNFPRPLFVVLIVAAMLACLSLQSSVVACPDAEQAALAFAQPSEQLACNEEVGFLDETAGIIPEFLSPERFAEEVCGGASLIVLEQIKRTRALDGENGNLFDQVRLANRGRLACSDCVQEWRLLLTLSSLHVRLQV